MNSKLIVRNFGPIDFVDLKLKNVNVFIGPQASGKSALAKIYTILKAPRKFLKIINSTFKYNSDTFEKILEDYNISSFLNEKTEIEFESELHTITYANGEIIYIPRLLEKIESLKILGEDFILNKEQIKRDIIDLAEHFILFKFKVEEILESDDSDPLVLNTKELDNLDEEKFSKVIERIIETETNLSTNTSIYIPAERNFINIIKNSSLNLLLNNVPIPKHILSFGAELEKATTKEIELDFVQKNLLYKNINGEDRIFTDNNHSIKLVEAASGVQSVLPILIPILSHHRLAGHRSFVIEEPELNLFPTAQYGLIKLLEKDRLEPYWEDAGTIHTYTTHSPYILSAINNLLYANKVRRSKKLIKRLRNNDVISDIIPAEISPYYFTAYQICNGKAESIFDIESGLIQSNYIDDASDEITEDFEALMNLMK